MRYFIITSGPAEGMKFTVPDNATEDRIREEAWDIMMEAIDDTSHETQEITAEQYADEFEGEE